MKIWNVNQRDLKVNNYKFYKDFRGHGIGTAMMKEILKYLKNAGYSKASLAVQKDNYALKMYLSVGFQIIDENKEEYIMVNYLR